MKELKESISEYYLEIITSKDMSLSSTPHTRIKFKDSKSLRNAFSKNKQECSFYVIDLGDNGKVIINIDDIDENYIVSLFESYVSENQ